MSMQTMLEEQIKDRLEEIEKIEVSSEDYKTAVEGLTKMMDRMIELQKIDQAAYDKEIDTRIKVEQIESEKKDRFISQIISSAGIALSTGVTIWGTLKSLKFEETGSVTTIMGRGFIQKLLPKK